jgi:hypothetical protein
MTFSRGLTKIAAAKRPLFSAASRDAQKITPAFMKDQMAQQDAARALSAAKGDGTWQ